MAEASNHESAGQIVYKPKEDRIWDPEFIRNVIFHLIQKLNPRNIVPCRYDIMMDFMKSISAKEENWLSVSSKLMESLPIDPNTTLAILCVMRYMQRPGVATVKKLVADRFQLSPQRARALILDVETEKNICIVLNCLAEIFVAHQSSQIFTNDLCSYLCHIFINSSCHNDAELEMRALLVLEKFAVTSESKKMIMDMFEKLNSNHLSDLENIVTNTPADIGIWRQFRFCVKWALDNDFPKIGRQLTYETVDMSGINVMVKNESGNYYLKYSPDLMEIRNDTIRSQTIHGTCKVTGGKWYYEVTLVTVGSFIIGWGITGSHMNHKVGSEEFSLGYEGDKELMWFYKQAHLISLGSWKEGDVLGCLLDINNETASFFLNGKEFIVTAEEFFAPTRKLKNFFPLITIPPFQQCCVNLGSKPFSNPPVGVRFSTFNSVGELPIHLKRTFGIPRRVTQQEDAVYNQSDEACVACCDRETNTTLHPCCHRILCEQCAKKVKTCPLCRSIINDRH